MHYIAGALLILVIIFVLKGNAASGEVYSRFGVRESTHRLLSTDLGKSESRLKLSRFGINGIADAVFKSLTGKSILVGEFKSRKHRGIVKLHEFYQLTLYMGHLKAQYPDHQIAGCLAYADSKVMIAYDSALYDALVSLRDEYWQTMRNSRPDNRTPLHKRMNVRTMNRGLSLSAEL